MKLHCPICKGKIQYESQYLRSIFGDSITYKVACLVTHYRHYHVSYYNNGVSYVAKFYDYSVFKIKVNNRAKRQLLRGILKDPHYSPDDIINFATAMLQLQYNDEKTLEMINTIIVPKQKSTLDDFFDPIENES